MGGGGAARHGLARPTWALYTDSPGFRFKFYKLVAVGPWETSCPLRSSSGLATPTPSELPQGHVSWSTCVHLSGYQVLYKSPLSSPRSSLPPFLPRLSPIFGGREAPIKSSGDFQRCRLDSHRTQGPVGDGSPSLVEKQGGAATGGGRQVGWRDGRCAEI